MGEALNREQVTEAVLDRLQGRRMVWAGLRADDAECLKSLPGEHYNFSLIGATGSERDPRSLALDEMSGHRVDPEIWDIDAHPNDPIVERFRRGILSALSSPSVLVPYRSTDFLSAIHLARRDTSLMLGLFGGQQSLFEYKPWVEVSISKTGVPVVPWRYIADEDRGRLRELPDGEYLIRRSRTSGGEGISRVSAMSDLVDEWPSFPDRLVGIAPFIDSIPVNVGATVWRDGVTVHNPSVQLIGIPSCVSREFGHCGNDFGAMRNLSPTALDEIERSTVTVGKWLHANGYLGSFGVDFLVIDDVALFAEVNPRFQGSTSTSNSIDVDLGLPCLLLEHIAAWLGMPRIDGPNLRERVAAAGAVSSVVVHWTGIEPRQLNGIDLARRVESGWPGALTDVVTSQHVINDPGSTVARLTLPGSVTESGFDLNMGLTSMIEDWRATQATPPRRSSIQSEGVV